MGKIKNVIKNVAGGTMEVATSKEYNNLLLLILIIIVWLYLFFSKGGKGNNG